MLKWLLVKFLRVDLSEEEVVAAVVVVDVVVLVAAAVVVVAADLVAVAVAAVVAKLVLETGHALVLIVVTQILRGEMNAIDVTLNVLIMPAVAEAACVEDSVVVAGVVTEAAVVVAAAMVAAVVVVDLVVAEVAAERLMLMVIVSNVEVGHTDQFIRGLCYCSVDELCSLDCEFYEPVLCMKEGQVTTTMLHVTLSLLLRHNC